MDTATDAGVPGPWTRQFGTKMGDEARALAADASGNVYVAGGTFAALAGQTAWGSVDAFVRKYDAHGAEQWTRQFGSTGADYAWSIAVDGVGNVYVGGWTHGTLPGQTSAGGADLFVRKYDSGGTEQWTRQFGSDADDHAYALSVHASGAVFFVGDIAGSFPGHSPGDPVAAVLRKYAGDGTEQWTKLIVGTGDTYVRSVSVGSGDAVYVTGYVNLGVLAGQTLVGEQDAFLRKYDSTGAEQWSRQFGTTSRDIAQAAAIDPAGNVYVGGYTEGAMQTGARSGGMTDVFLRKYSGSGAEQWTRQFGWTDDDYGHSVAVDAASNVYIGGSAERIEAPPAQPQLLEAVVRMYDGTGTERWTQAFGASGSDVVYGVSACGAGAVCVAGVTAGALAGQTSAGGTDAFVKVLAP